MKKKSKPTFAQPDPEKDKAALKAHYEQVVTTDDDTEGIGKADLDKIAELAAALKKAKR